MSDLLSRQELITSLAFEYSRNTVLSSSKENRRINIDSFLELDRTGLEYNHIERRLLLYTTLKNERVYIQYPGKESEGNRPKPYDFRPKVRMSDGSIMRDVSFGAIWDMMDMISRKTGERGIEYIATLLLRIGYMYDYRKVSELIPMIELDIQERTECEEKEIPFEWLKMSFKDDVWLTLNDYIGDIEGDDYKISFEAFIKMIDLLFQNEDCKYYYINAIDKNKDYRLNNGRPNSSAANLLILNYLKGNMSLSGLIDSFQKSRGVPSFKKTEYGIVTGGMVVNIDSQ